MARFTPLVPQTLAWAATAPITMVGSATSPAPPEAVFAELSDHERWPEWFPNVKRVEVLGPASGVGARRRVHIPGSAVEEEFIAWEPGSRWAFTGTAARPGFLRSLVEDCQLAPTSTGGTDITYSMHLQAAPRFGPLLAVARPVMARGLQKGIVQLARRAARQR